MAKRKYGWTEAKIARFIKEGRGQGELSNYKPWLTTYDVPSEGRTHRILGLKNERIHHLLSDLERNYFYLSEWSDQVIDIREQFPLNREITTAIAERVGIKHPEDSTSKTPLVMTTDFYITARIDNEVINLARTIKPSKDLNSSRVIEKFEIERVYWEDKNIDWGIVTEKELHKETIENIVWLRSSKKLSEAINPTLIELLMNSLKKESGTIIYRLNEFDATYQLTGGTALSILKHLIAHKRLKVDLTKKIDLETLNIDFTSMLKSSTSERWGT
ncbi:TnsA endonuclease N-terminal domain-containing protein [Halalkalibacter sp. APA_J-10(15)]|uniref:TnsA endonuclease N-terminal domain-containing protein n=1 Tax=Halalkalibacter sp. APA_J-10(15) TaxID=2933805 RepID=UPI001FF289F5|nr:TnsA endonuclease N-terminal domain-containing protein [Halalkalibacter sp. APA_J-10(15)]MCK0473762.1 TnsA endonuclease N-terminal domain-containing protein [Halalkalibacter sp. APA_J-10(15)]